MKGQPTKARFLYSNFLLLLGNAESKVGYELLCRLLASCVNSVVEYVWKKSNKILYNISSWSFNRRVHWTDILSALYFATLKATRLLADSCHIMIYIFKINVSKSMVRNRLNQIPNATINTFLNNSKPAHCRVIAFNPWLDKYVRHLIFEFERSAWFHARTIAFCLTVPPFEKVTKQKEENSLFHFSFTLLKHFVFVICRHLTTLNWLKVLKLRKLCSKNDQSHDTKNNRP